MRRSIVAPVAALAAAAAGVAGGSFLHPSLGSAARGAEVDFHIVDQAVSVDRNAGTATFMLKFDRAPDFVAIDHGQAHAFQYELDADGASLANPIEWDQIDSVIRGAELWEGRGLPVRDRDGDGADANSGGFGPVRALLPYDVSGDTLSFTTGLSALGDSGDGVFRYRVFTTDNGGITSEMQGAAIPLPAAAWTGAIALGGMGVSLRKMRRAFR
jgi:hypothetical protein